MFINIGMELWNEDKVLDLVDPSLQHSLEMVEVQKCTQIGLLCVQENQQTGQQWIQFEAASLPAPKKPAFSIGQIPRDSDVCASSSINYSANGVTISTVTGR
ncbi:S-locus receptor kinase, C-terminal [Dillenia turbinata]|uniref:S-locus receptor kinase, C-terminal n=1 Tax=Dillenia turbinata TaxID=194707 RepID=A0AAN8ZBM1_9MAGN